MGKLLHEDLTYRVIGAAQEVHRELGPGYLESVYEDALCHELDQLGIPFERQVDLDVHYKNVVFTKRFRADLVIAGKVLVENKASNGLSPQDEAQLINYLKTTGVRVGFLFNFGAAKFEMLRRVL
jgi:GxxExxY protein